MRVRTGAGLLLLALAGAACGPKPGSAPRRPDPVPVRVTNQNRADVVVSLVRQGTVQRLGTVVTGQTQVLTIRNVPVDRLQAIQFDLHLIGTEGTVRTRPVSLGPGQMVVLRIEDLLSTSQITVAEDGGSDPRMP